MQTLSQIQSTFQQYLVAQTLAKQPTHLYDPIDYIMQLGGKRLRPALLLMSYNLFSTDMERALPAAYCIELFHNFSLVHDDIMDAAPLRRGKPTVHTKWNLNTGILSGDAMLILCYDYLLAAKAGRKLAEIIAIFNKTAIEVCEGQQYDMDFEQRTDVKIETYIEMIALKTSVLLAAALQIGALLGGASKKNATHLYEFGKNIGIAFQLQDDILDAFGDPALFGKKLGGDIVQNKKTYLVIKALELADIATKNELFQWMNTPTTDENAKIQAILHIFNRLEVRAAAEMEQSRFLATAFQHLEKVTVAPDKKNILIDLANELMLRKH
jgi:geranylgeranyl diphosphate synthase, type II